MLAGVPVCGTCGNLGTQLLGHRAQVEPFSRSWHQRLRELATFRALSWLLVLTCAIQYLTSFPTSPRAWLLGRLLMLGWLFYVTRRGGRGLGPFGPPTYGDLFSVWRGPLIRALPVLAPLALISAYLVGAGSHAIGALLWVGVPVAVLAAPVLAAALPAVTIEGDGRRWARPGPLLEASRVLRGEYPALLGLTSAVLGVQLLAALLEPLNMEDTQMERTIARMFALDVGTMVLLTALGMLAGGLLVTWAVELGHDSGERASLPWVSALPEREWTPPRPDESALAAERAERFKAIELEAPAAGFEQALAAGRPEEALALLEREAPPLSSVGSDALVSLAQGLAARGAPRQAAWVLEQLRARDCDPALPRALVILARLLGERLGEPERAGQLFEEVVRRFPGTSAAAFASERLSGARASP